MKKRVFSKDGSDLGSINLEEKVFGIKISYGSLYNAVKNELANFRVGTASTKTRSEVEGSSLKPWKQKGTGRARVGTKRNPIWVGGGIALGPKQRSYAYRIPKKVKRLAIKSVLSLRASEDNFKVVEDFTIDSGKTKELVLIVKNFIKSFDSKTVILLGNDDCMVKRAGKNIKNLKILSYDKLRVTDLFYTKNVIALESAINELNTFYIK